MRKKLVKLALTITALSVLPFLQGCIEDDDEDNSLARNAFAPVGSMGAFGIPVMGGQGGNGSGQGATAGSQGSGVRVGSTGGGGQVASGAAF